MVIIHSLTLQRLNTVIMPQLRTYRISSLTFTLVVAPSKMIKKSTEKKDFIFTLGYEGIHDNDRADELVKGGFFPGSERWTKNEEKLRGYTVVKLWAKHLIRNLLRSCHRQRGQTPDCLRFTWFSTRSAAVQNIQDVVSSIWVNKFSPIYHYQKNEFFSNSRQIHYICWDITYVRLYYSYICTYVCP